MRLARVPRPRAEELRKVLASMGGVRRDRKIQEDGDFVLIPITDAVDLSVADRIGLEIVEGRAARRNQYRSPMDRVLEESEDWMRPFLPRKWEKLGEILIVRFPQELSHGKEDISRIYARVLGAKTVCEDVGGIEGTFRTPRIKVILGSSTETIHQENGILYKMDVTKVMFSSGNIDERQRMASRDCYGETVVDMFAGIGYFTLPIAVHGGAKRVIACEINPDAQRYLEENIVLNEVTGRVEVYKGDNRELPGEGIADRVIMGYVDTHGFLGKGIELVRPGGIVHYHDTSPVDMVDRLLERVKSAAGSRGAKIIQVREVKSYAPAISHYVVDFRVLD